MVARKFLDCCVAAFGLIMVGVSILTNTPGFMWLTMVAMVPMLATVLVEFEGGEYGR